MINSESDRQKGSKNPKKRRTQPEKVGRRKWIIRKLKSQDEILRRIDRRTRMLAAGLRELLVLGEDYVSMVACKDETDLVLLNALKEAGSAGRQSRELAEILRIDYRRVSERIERINRRMDQEIGEHIIEKNGHKWKLVARLRRDLQAQGESVEAFQS